MARHLTYNCGIVTAECERGVRCSHKGCPSTSQAEEKERERAEGMLHIVIGNRCKEIMTIHSACIPLRSPFSPNLFPFCREEVGVSQLFLSDSTLDLYDASGGSVLHS